MKARILFFSNKKKVEKYATLATQYLKCDKKPDVIPPSFSCDKERLVIIGMTVGHKIPDPLRRFCAEMDLKHASNVAFFVDGPESVAFDLMNVVTVAGANIIENIFYIHGGSPIPFLNNSISEEEKNSFCEWLDLIQNQMV